MLFGGEVSAFDAAFPHFLISTGAAGLMLLMASTLYVLLTPWKELSLVRSGNTAAPSSALPFRFPQRLPPR